MRIGNVNIGMNTNMKNSIAYNMAAKSSSVFRQDKLGRDRVDFSLSARSQGINATAPIRKVKTAGLIITDLKISKSSLEGSPKSFEISNATVSNERAALGTSENRLGGNSGTIDNSYNKNIEAGESRDRHIDKARETMKRVQNDLLDYPLRSTLAQGNSDPRAVSHLLR